MAHNLNQFTFSGRLSSDPRMVYTKNGVAITTITLPLSDDYFDKEKKEWIQRTNWVNVRFFREKAESVAKRCEKGTHVIVQGKIVQIEYENGNGEKVRGYDFVADYVEITGGAKPKDTQESHGEKRNSEAEEEDSVPW